MATAVLSRPTGSFAPRHQLPPSVDPVMPAPAKESPFRALAGMSPEAAAERLLFHGTTARITGPLRGGGYDGVIWTAEQPDVAQTYMPASGITTYIAAPREWELDSRVSPDKQFEAPMLRQMGYQFDVQHDDIGKAISWTSRDGRRMPRRRELFAYLRGHMGYQESGRFSGYEVKTTYETLADGSSQVRYLPAAHRDQGSLFIMAGKDRLRVLDVAAETEGDEMNPQYNNHRWFRAAEAKGYDAIRIWDFAQSKKWGNVEHTSIGLLRGAIDKLDVVSMPAVHFDWGDQIEKTMTPEYLAWHRSLGGRS
jgi:hypothetical protein